MAVKLLAILLFAYGACSTAFGHLYSPNPSRGGYYENPAGEQKGAPIPPKNSNVQGGVNQAGGNNANMQAGIHQTSKSSEVNNSLEEMYLSDSLLFTDSS